MKTEKEKEKERAKQYYQKNKERIKKLREFKTTLKKDIKDLSPVELLEQVGYYDE